MLTTLKKGSDKKLLDIIARHKDAPVGYYVVHLRFSGLMEHYKSEYQHKITINIVNDILSSAEGNVGICADDDIIIICKDIFPNVLKKMIFQLRYLYMDDPLAYEPDGKENSDFAKIYELKPDWEELFAILKAKLAQQDMKERKKVVEQEPWKLTPASLINIEVSMNKMNIAGALRNQPVCAVRADGIKTMFSEVYINLVALSEILRTNINFASEKSLFKYLTQTLDRKVLEYIAKTPHKYLKSALSMNLNVATLLTSAFAEFDSHLSEKTKSSIIIEIQIADIFSDMQAFVAARELVQKSGYRICLDGLTNLSFMQVDRTSLGFDLAKLFWNADIKSDTKKKQGQLLADAIERCGKSRIILARCDNKDAIYYGQSLGISLFQGRYIDSLIDPKSEILN